MNEEENCTQEEKRAEKSDKQDLALMMYELFHKKGQLRDIHAKHNQLKEKMERQHLERFEKLKTVLEDQEKEIARKCIFIAKHHVKRLENAYGERDEFKILLKIICILASDLIERSPADTEYYLKQLGAEVDIML